MKTIPYKKPTETTLSFPASNTRVSAIKYLSAALLLAFGADASAATRINQVGFEPQSEKLAVVTDGTASSFEVVAADTGKTVFTGKLGAPALWKPSAETVRLADFSALKTPGEYRIKIDGQTLSDRFAIRDHAYRALNAAAIKAYYLNRASIALPPQYAGAYARPAGHPDDKVLVHSSAASRQRAEGSVLSSPKGWYDAGDYNKYIVNSGISTYTLLAAFEHFPQYFAKQNLNIPESGNGLPDILNEALWNLDWMLTMQDPNDGGVYHKLTNKAFDGMEMPDQVKPTPRYVVQKSTAAALDFAATMATAGRIFKAYEQQRPGLSARMMAAAETAWNWAQANPAVVFRNPADIKTGEYGDAQLGDEFAWAAAELYIGTGKDSYYRAIKADQLPATTPSWSDVGALAWISLAQHRAHLTPAADRKLIESRIDGLAASLAANWKASAYRVAMQEKDFVWGSNATVLNQAMMLLQGYRLNGKADYLNAAQSGLDYVLGRNATGYSFVTGIGARPAMHPHHRPSAADKLAAPAPGFLVGGPQPGQQDKKDCPVPYPAKLPATSYLDHVCSYASNEIAINWNAPLVYVSAALDQLTAGASMEQKVELSTLTRQEELLQFDSFNNDTALALGMKVIELARAAGKSVAVNITQDGTMLFYHGMPGTNADNANWIRRKSNLVNRTGHSSFYTHTEVKNAGGDYDHIPGMDMKEFAAHGGSFPLVVKGKGRIGTLTVSGLPGAEDHAMAVAALQAYLNVDL
ncbi:heme-degrading domain-containing protein [Duganella radicis]|uniref:Endoglucanase n=1 Tax=Duganella radicis TaxID=551988 RepID=A0A6L6PDR5_9BURK|nr:heme-degrading domain-containing protein [Duganella radicis]MTV37170.1 heme-degrading domain-containing protein [Duganella radicis]